MDADSDKCLIIVAEAMLRNRITHLRRSNCQIAVVVAPFNVKWRKLKHLERGTFSGLYIEVGGTQSDLTDKAKNQCLSMIPLK